MMHPTGSTENIMKANPVQAINIAQIVLLLVSQAILDAMQLLFRASVRKDVSTIKGTTSTNSPLACKAAEQSMPR